MEILVLFADVAIMVIVAGNARFDNNSNLIDAAHPIMDRKVAYA